MGSNLESRNNTRFEYESFVKLKDLKTGRINDAIMYNYCTSGLYFETDLKLQPENEIVSAKGFKLFGNLFGKGKKKGNSHGPKLNFWTFADIGVYGFNQITHSDLAIDRIRDDEGNIVAYSLLNSDVRVPSGKSKKTRKDQPLYD